MCVCVLCQRRGPWCWTAVDEGLDVPQQWLPEHVQNMDQGDLEGPSSRGSLRPFEEDNGLLQAVLEGLLQCTLARNIEALDRQAAPYLPVNKLERQAAEVPGALLQPLRPSVADGHQLRGATGLGLERKGLRSFCLLFVVALAVATEVTNQGRSEDGPRTNQGRNQGQTNDEQ